MSGHKNFKILREKIGADPERRKRVEEIGYAYDAVLLLTNLREHRGEDVTKRLDEVYGVEASGLDPTVAELQGRCLAQDEW